MVVIHNGKVAKVVEVKVMVEVHSGLEVVETAAVVEKHSIPVLAAVEKVAAA